MVVHGAGGGGGLCAPPHDLKKVFNETAYKETGIKRAFDNGIPKPAVVSFHEGEAFAAVIRSAADAQGTSIEINGNEDKVSEAYKNI